MIIRRIQSVSWLIFIFLLFCQGLAVSADNIDDLVLLKDVVLCKKCHEEHGAQWPKSSHARSFNNKPVLRGFRDFLVNSPGAAGRELKKTCFPCHAPQARNVSDKLLREIAALIMSAVDDKNSPEGISAMTELSKISIDCGVCHLINGMPEGQVQPNTIYGPGWDENEKSHTREHGFATVGSVYLMSSRMCTRCHKWPAGTPSAVLSYHKNSGDHFRMADENNKTCQQCHMMDGDRIIHNMPKYAGSIGFSVQQTADVIGTGLAAVTFLSMLIHMLGRALFTRAQREKRKDMVMCESAGMRKQWQADTGDDVREGDTLYTGTDWGTEDTPTGTACEEEGVFEQPRPGAVPGGEHHDR